MVYSCELDGTHALPIGARRAIEGSVCALGVFDGIHRGHAHLIAKAGALAREDGCNSVCITFDTDPDEMFHPAFKKIMGNDARIERLSDAGFDDTVVLRFTRAFSELQPVDFLDRIFGANLPRALIVADDFRFGHRAQGSVPELREWGDANGVEVCAIHLFEDGRAPVTSTRIRAHLMDGEVERANELMGHPFAFRSVVLEGRHAGRDMGFKTANLHIPEALFVLKPGVYAGRALIDGSRYKAAVSVGVSPTFADEATANVEAHVLDYDGDLYGKTIEVEILCRMRDMIKFDDINVLISQVMSDIAYARDQVVL